MVASELELFGVRTSARIKSMPATATPEPGLYNLVEFDQYHRWKDPDGWPLCNASALNQLAKSPAHYWHYATSESEPSAAMRFGTLCHAGQLEPEAIRARFCCIPPDLYRDVKKKDGTPATNPQSTTAGKKLKAEFLRKHKGKTVVTVEEFGRMLALVTSLKSNAHAMSYLTTGHPEYTIVWDDAETGIRCKARLDYWQGDRDRVTDLKTTRDASAPAFQRALVNYGYYRQAAWYLEAAQQAGLDAQYFAFVAVESEAPHGITAAEVHPETLEQGKRENRALLRQLQNCRTQDHWPSYECPGCWELPSWAKTNPER